MQLLYNVATPSSNEKFLKKAESMFLSKLVRLKKSCIAFLLTAKKYVTKIIQILSQFKVRINALKRINNSINKLFVENRNASRSCFDSPNTVSLVFVYSKLVVISRYGPEKFHPLFLCSGTDKQ